MGLKTRSSAGFLGSGHRAEWCISQRFTRWRKDMWQPGLLNNLAHSRPVIDTDGVNSTH